MTHLRTEISDKFVTSLTDLSTTGDNVFYEATYTTLNTQPAELG